MRVAEPIGWTGGRYSVFRVLLGCYLLWHFAALLPWGAELWSNQGMLPDASASPIAYLFPNVLTWFDPPWFVTSLLALACIASVALAVGWRDRVAAIGLWYIWTCLLGRNPLILNPGLPYVGWILVAHAFTPRAPYGALDARQGVNRQWHMPAPIFVSAWILMAVGYSYSGYTKLISPSWIDGTAVAHVLDNPLARPTVIRDLLLMLPDQVLSTLTWGTLAFELSFAPLALFRRLRPWLWLAGLLMHGTLLVLIDFADLSLGMVMLHLFTFNPAWLMSESPINMKAPPPRRTQPTGPPTDA